MTAHLGSRVRRFVHLACVVATAAVLALPLLLGPGAAWALRAVGGEPVHRCACGMQQGKCGCPECALLAHARAEAKRAARASGERAIRTSCNDDDAPLAAGALPAATIPSAALPPAPPDARDVDPLAPRAPRVRGRARPPLPVPRA